MTAKTRSLIYREMMVGRIFYFSTLGGCALFLALIWLVRLSLVCGNLSRLSDDDYKMIEMMVYTMSIYFTTITMGILASCNSVGVSDIKARWKKYSFALPVSPKEAVNVKLMIKVFWTVFGLALSVLNAWLTCLASDRKLDSTTLLLIIWIFNIILLADLISTPVQLRARTEKEASYATFFLFSLFIPALIGTYLLNKEAMHRLKPLKEAIPEEEYSDSMELVLTFSIYKDIFSSIIDKVKFFALPAMVVILAAYYFLCYKAVQRRED